MNYFNYPYDDLFNPLLKALHNLGGSASISEMEDEVANILELTEDEINEIHRGNRTKFSYRLAWARSYLKQYGLIENSQRGVWLLTAIGQDTNNINKEKIKKDVAQQYQKKRTEEESKLETIEEELVEQTWQEDLLEVIQNIPPEKFERLCQRMLRELGFSNVEVTGRSGDGGIDGKGMIRMGGVLSFHIVFQCKRYQGSVSPSIIRDFRGAMVGRADKGLLITTGTFTREAKKEASRDGAPPIDLVDGLDFTMKLKELNLGVITEKVEKVTINNKWFDEF